VASVDEHGAAVLQVEDHVIRFGQVGMLSDDANSRYKALDLASRSGEISIEKEGVWRDRIAAGPLDDDMFGTFQEELHGTPESILRDMVDKINEGQAQFDDLIPLETDYYSELLGGLAPPLTLKDFRVEWLAAAQKLDPARLVRLLRLSAPLSILGGGLVAEASDGLPESDRLALAAWLGRAVDPLSVITALEIALRNRSEEGFEELFSRLSERLLDRSNALTERATPALIFAYSLVTSLTAQNRTLVSWPIYAKRLARILHASHLVRLFQTANVNGEVLQGELMRNLSSEAQLADLCDIWQAPFAQFNHFSKPLVHAIILARTTEALAKIDEAERPAIVHDMCQSAITSAVEAGWGIYLFAPTPLDEFEDEAICMTLLSPENARNACEVLTAGGDTNLCLNELVKLAVGFDLPHECIAEFQEALLNLLERFDGPNFVVAAEIGLQLAARWRLEALSDHIVDRLLNQARDPGLSDVGAGARLMMLAAAVLPERASWLQRAGNLMQHLAYIQNGSLSAMILLRALDILKDVEPELGRKMASARSYALLAHDRIHGSKDEGDQEGTIG
jgi:hypothetical protein